MCFNVTLCHFTVQFHFWEYINPIFGTVWTFILDSHWPFICSALRRRMPWDWTQDCWQSGGLTARPDIIQITHLFSGSYSDLFSRLAAAVSGSLVISSPFTSSAIRKKTDLFTKTVFIFCGDLWYLDEPGLYLKTSNQEEIKRYFFKSVESLSLSLFY